MATTIERPPVHARERATSAPRRDDAVRLRPTPRGRRVRVPELVLGVLLVGVFGLGAVLWWSSSTASAPVAVLRVPLAAGAVVTEADLRPADVTLSAGVGAVAWSARSQLVGKSAVAALPAGAVLVPGLVAEQPVLAAGEALVGLKLGPGGYPAGSLAPGDSVAVVAAASPVAGDAAGSSRQPDVLASQATVWEVTPTADAEATVLVTLRLAEADAQRVSAAADQVRVVRVVR